MQENPRGRLSESHRIVRELLLAEAARVLLPQTPPEAERLLVEVLMETLGELVGQLDASDPSVRVGHGVSSAPEKLE